MAEASRFSLPSLSLRMPRVHLSPKAKSALVVASLLLGSAALITSGALDSWQWGVGLIGASLVPLVPFLFHKNKVVAPIIGLSESEHHTRQLEFIDILEQQLTDTKIQTLFPLEIEKLNSSKISFLLYEELSKIYNFIHTYLHNKIDTKEIESSFASTTEHLYLMKRLDDCSLENFILDRVQPLPDRFKQIKLLINYFTSEVSRKYVIFKIDDKLYIIGSIKNNEFETKTLQLKMQGLKKLEDISLDLTDQEETLVKIFADKRKGANLDPLSHLWMVPL